MFFFVFQLELLEALRTYYSTREIKSRPLVTPGTLQLFPGRRDGFFHFPGLFRLNTSRGFLNRFWFFFFSSPGLLTREMPLEVFERTGRIILHRAQRNWRRVLFRVRSGRIIARSRGTRCFCIRFNSVTINKKIFRVRAYENNLIMSRPSRKTIRLLRIGKDSESQWSFFLLIHEIKYADRAVHAPASTIQLLLVEKYKK